MSEISPMEFVDAYLLKCRTLQWEEIPDIDKAKMFNYIMSICISKPNALSLVSDIIMKSQSVPIGLSWDGNRAYLLDKYRDRFVTNKKNRYHINWLSFQPKIKERVINHEALKFGMRCIGKNELYNDILKCNVDKNFLKWCEKEYKLYKKLI